jgi:hypothetical protein
MRPERLWLITLLALKQSFSNNKATSVVTRDTVDAPTLP